MGYQVTLLDPTPNCPTAQIADGHIVAAYDDMDAIKELTEISDVVTYEFENVDLNAAKYIEEAGKLTTRRICIRSDAKSRKRENINEECRFTCSSVFNCS